jgi:hypothetical protein
VRRSFDSLHRRRVSSQRGVACVACNRVDERSLINASRQRLCMDWVATWRLLTLAASFKRAFERPFLVVRTQMTLEVEVSAFHRERDVRKHSAVDRATSAGSPSECAAATWNWADELPVVGSSTLGCDLCGWRSDFGSDSFGWSAGWSQVAVRLLVWLANCLGWSQFGRWASRCRRC